jgi:Ca-activated chloride channel family protein
MKAILKVFVLAAALGAGTFWVSAAPTFRSNVDMVMLSATITDSLGNYIDGLTEKDFRILENGVEQKISGFVNFAQRKGAKSDPESAAASVFVLFDTSNYMYDSFPYAEDAVADFIRCSYPADSIAVYSFSRNMMRLAPLTRDRQRALVGLRDAVTGDDTGLYDSLLLTLLDASKVQGRKAVVVFSNGPDNASVLAPDDVRRVAEDEGIPIYLVTTKDKDVISNAVFHRLTTQTGGKTYYATDWNKQKAAFASIKDDLDNSYVISYYPVPSEDPGFRKIEVEIVGDTGHTYRVRARSGYNPRHIETISHQAPRLTPRS